jgi:hypothetical protein
MLPFGLLAVPLVVAAPIAKDAPKKEPPSLVGEWVLETRTAGGVPGTPFALSGALRYTFTADSECVVSTGRGVPPGRYSFAADPKADPPRSPSAGRARGRRWLSTGFTRWRATP